MLNSNTWNQVPVGKNDKYWIKLLVLDTNT